MTSTYSFGEWLKQRRKQLKLTQREVATAVAFFTFFEGNERGYMVIRPSPKPNNKH